MKPTKTEEKMIARAKEQGSPYYQRFTDYRQACPYCLQPLSSDEAFKYKCGCSTWEYDFRVGRYTREGKAERNG